MKPMHVDDDYTVPLDGLSYVKGRTDVPLTDQTIDDLLKAAIVTAERLKSSQYLEMLASLAPEIAQCAPASSGPDVCRNCAA